MMQIPKLSRNGRLGRMRVMQEVFWPPAGLSDSPSHLLQLPKRSPAWCRHLLNGLLHAPPFCNTHTATEKGRSSLTSLTKGPANTHTHIRTHIYTHTHTHTQIRTHTQTHTHTHTHILTCTHTNTHTYTTPANSILNVPATLKRVFFLFSKPDVSGFGLFLLFG